MFNRRIFAALATVIILLVVLLGRPFAAHSDNTLFTPLTEKPSRELRGTGGIIDALRLSAVQVNWSALQPQTETLSLNLFHDVTLNARLRRVDEMANGGFVWVGDIEEEAGSSVTLSVQGGILAGTIYRDGVEWGVIRYAGHASDGAHLVIELDPHAPQPFGRDYAIPRPGPGEIASLSRAQEETCVEDGSQIDVLVAYTSAARQAMGGPEAMEAHINKQISDMNSANDFSQAAFDWRLVHTMEVDYGESGSLWLDLQNLQKMSDGILDEIHVARDNHKADLVALIVAEGNTNACGYAFQLAALEGWFQGYSFAIAALDYPGHFTCSSMTLSHELGHNMGNAHNRAHASGTVLFPFSYGFQSLTGKYRDIMSYDCPNGCPRVNHWANPDVWYAGEQTGIDYEIDPINAADLVESMNRARVLVSNFRPNCGVDLSATPTENVTPTDTATPTAIPTETLLPTETPPTETPPPTSSPTPTSTPTTEATVAAPDPSPTSDSTSAVSPRLFLPAVLDD